MALRFRVAPEGFPGTPLHTPRASSCRKTEAKRHAHSAEVPWTTARLSLADFSNQDPWPVRGNPHRPSARANKQGFTSAFKVMTSGGRVTECLPTLPLACRTLDDEIRNRPPTRPGRRMGNLGSTGRNSMSAAEQDREMFGVPKAKYGLAQDDLVQCDIMSSRSATPCRSKEQGKTNSNDACARMQ
mmetsp:Transcript_70229/g.139077  ORF Transcript_70229/g.139077 Transcript_70229/m.139077 type:complete len:186 (-) Transcript_70229:171-728(-)